MLIIACASVYAVAHYIINCEDDEGDVSPAPVYEIKPVDFLEPEDKCLFT
jgi:hypothetical protein